MKITVPDTAIETLKSILAENTDKPQNIRAVSYTHLTLPTIA